MQVLAIEGMEFYAKHGYYAHEKEIGGRYVVDVYLTLDLTKAGKSDQLEDTLNYEVVFNIVQDIMNTSKNLIEHLAHLILEEINEAFQDLNHIRVKVKKIAPPLKGQVENTFVIFEKAINS